MNNFLDKAKGSILGLALGDALGTTLEFKPKDSYEHITDMHGGGPFNLNAGQWTDDTAMMIGLAESLIQSGKNNPIAQLYRYHAWYYHGVYSCTGKCFDIGNTVRAAITKFDRSKEGFCGSTAPQSAGNGSLMRLAPIPLFFYQSSLAVLFKEAEISSKTTHGEARCIQACQLMSYYLQRIYTSDINLSKQNILAITHELTTLSTNWHQDINDILNGKYLDKTRDEIFGTGYVVQSLEAALWCFVHSDNFEQGALLAANLGDDADTTAAIYGQLAGAYYGYEKLPQHWLAKLAWKEELEQIACGLVDASNNQKNEITQAKINQISKNIAKAILHAGIDSGSPLTAKQIKKFTSNFIK